MGSLRASCVAIAIVMSACGRIGFDAIGGDGSSLPTRRSQLTLRAPAESLMQFPLLVTLDDQRAARDQMQADASDLRFFDAGGNLLPHEIEQLGSPGGPPLLAWVQVPVIDGPTTIELDYGHGTPVAPASASVWSDSYAAVFHLGDLVDSTPRRVTGTWVGGAETIIDGRLAKAHTFHPATTDAIMIADNAVFTFGTALTLSGWVQPRTLTASSGYNAMLTREYTGSDEDFWVGIEDATAHGFSELGTPGGSNQGGGGGPITTGSWFHIAVSYDGITERLYVDGVGVRSTPVTGGGVRHSPNPIVIAADRNAGGNPDADFFDGSIDEVRLETVVRSPAWIAYDVASMRDELITYGPVGP